jgi:hypothetical protein
MPVEIMNGVPDLVASPTNISVLFFLEMIPKFLPGKTSMVTIGTDVVISCLVNI